MIDLQHEVKTMVYPGQHLSMTHMIEEGGKYTNESMVYR